LLAFGAFTSRPNLRGRSRQAVASNSGPSLTLPP
jgi:hypothetical protein